MHSVTGLANPVAAHPAHRFALVPAAATAAPAPETARAVTQPVIWTQALPFASVTGDMAGTDLEPNAQQLAAAVVSGKLTPAQAAAQAGVTVDTVNQWVSSYVSVTRAAFEQRAKAVLVRARSQTLVGGAGFRGAAQPPARAIGAAVPPAPREAALPTAPAAGLVGPTALPTIPARAPGLGSAPRTPLAVPTPALQPPAVPPPHAAQTPVIAQPPPSARARYSGPIEGTALFDAARGLGASRQSGTLEVRTDVDSGVIHFIQGEIIDADYRGLRGQDALWRLLDIHRGTFELRSIDHARQRTIHLDVPSLLAEAERRSAAARIIKRQLGSARQVFVLAEISRAQAASLRSVDNQLLTLFDGKRTLKQVVQSAAFDEFSTLSQIARLLESGHLLPSSLRPMAVSIAAPRLETAQTASAATDTADIRLSSIPAPRRARGVGRWVAAGAVMLGGAAVGILLPNPSRHSLPDLLVQVQSEAKAQLDGVIAKYRGTRPAAPTTESSTPKPAVAAIAIPYPEAPVAAVETAACPAGMVWIAPGSFRMGSDAEHPALSSAHPVHEVKMSEGYCMDQHEVTTEQYANCVSDKRCSSASASAHWPQGGMTTKEWVASRKLHSTQCNGGPNARWNHPINCVSWNQANAYCEAHAARLPTEAEWEFAARGSQSRTYPWGNSAPSPNLLNGCGTECEVWHKSVGLSAEITSHLFADDDGYPGTAPVGSFPDGATPEGVYDLVGNVFEWTASAMTPYQSGAGEAAEDSTADVEAHVIRGGAFNSGDPVFTNPALRFAAANQTFSHGIGFRCVAPAASDPN